MSNKKSSKCVIQIPPNKYGIFAVCGKAVEIGEITEENVEGIMDSLSSILENVQPLLSKDRGSELEG